jgi:hypothetical protein
MPKVSDECLVYTMVRILAEEKVFVNFDTLEPLPIITEHLRILENTCGPLANYDYGIRFTGPQAEANKVKFMSHPRMKVALQNYIDRYLKDRPAGNMPPPPAWIDISPGSNSELNALFSQRLRSRKQRKQQKQTRKQKQVKRK